MANELTLEEVAAQLKDWRTTKTPGQKIPNEIWEAIIDLTSRYKKSKILVACNISSEQLKNKIAKLRPELVESVSDGFVKMSTVMPSVIKAHITNTRGLTMDFSISSEVELSMVFKAFGGL